MFSSAVGLVVDQCERVEVEGVSTVTIQHQRGQRVTALGLFGDRRRGDAHHDAVFIAYSNDNTDGVTDSAWRSTTSGSQNWPRGDRRTWSSAAPSSE